MVLLVLPALLAACMAQRSEGHILTLRQGETGSMGNQQVTLLSLQDSRCPKNVDCVWAGELVTNVKVVGNGPARELTLRLPEATNTPWLGLRILSATERITPDGPPVQVTLTDLQAASQAK